jgi:DNA-binding NarL/FixJ family response regulator
MVSASVHPSHSPQTAVGAVILLSIALAVQDRATLSVADKEGLVMTKASLAKRDPVPPIQISPAAMALASTKRAIAAGQPRTPRWSAPGGDVIVLDRRARNRAAEDSFPAVRVLLADGEKLVRAGLRELLEEGGGIAVAGEAASGREAVALAARIRPDVVLMNVRLPGLDGVEATRRIIADPELSEVEVLLLGEEERDEDLFVAVRAGASGFLTMDTEPAELLRAVRALAGGEVELSPSVTRRLIDEFASQPEARRSAPELFEELSVREREVVALVALGLTNDEIAEQLVVSPATAKTHVSRAMVKLHAHDRAKLVALAYQTGFAQPRRDHGPDRLRTRKRGHRPHSRLPSGA